MEFAGSQRVYRFLLRLLPATFRKRYGPNLEDSFVEMLLDARERRGHRGVAAAWLAGAWDLLRHVPRLRRPLRLLPSWESMLMGHADKTWTVPDEADRKQIWRKAAFVAAVAIARGRVVATWTHKQQRGRLAVEVQPLSRWQASKHAAQVRREARAVAAHLELDDAEVTIAN